MEEPRGGSTTLETEGVCLGCGRALLDGNAAFCAFCGRPVGAVPDQAAATTRSRRHRGWLVAGVVAFVLAVAGGTVGGWVWWQGKPDRDYLSALAVAGLRSQFGSDAEAIAHARALCARLEIGGKPEGNEADREATRAYCPSFTPGFRVLTTAKIVGRFLLLGTTAPSSGIAANARECTGVNGFSDIRAGAQVTVKNGEGEFLASAQLGPGIGNSVMCAFDFALTLTEGEDTYVVTISHRGDTHFTWGQLAASNFITLSLGT
jgi:hypothetical protein